MARSGFTTIITLFTTDKSEVEIYSSFKATYPDTNMFNYHFNITCTSFLYINKRPSCIGQQLNCELAEILTVSVVNNGSLLCSFKGKNIDLQQNVYIEL